MLENQKKEQSIIEYIKKKCAEDIILSKENLIKVSIYINQLNSYIDGELTLSSNKIYNMLRWLYMKFTISLAYDLDENIVVLRRARKYDKKNSEVNYFTDIQDLICIPDILKDKVELGRMNQEKEPMYYGIISHSKFNQFHVALSEVDAMEYDIINTLDSMLDSSIRSCHIGAFDMFIRGEKLPSYIHPFNKKVYKTFQDECKEKNSALLESYILCNAFFADIFRRKNEGNLYKVTSTLASIVLKDANFDSIIYESVQVKGAPVIVIKPSVVYSKMRHETTMACQVKENLGYGLYTLKVLAEGEIINNRCIEWENIK